MIGVWHGPKGTFMTVYQATSCHCSISIPPEKIKKPDIFRCFQGGEERDQWHEMGKPPLR